MSEGRWVQTNYCALQQSCKWLIQGYIVRGQQEVEYRSPDFWWERQVQKEKILALYLDQFKLES